MSELVISIDQPYASLIMLGVKRFETRPSPPNGDMRPDGVRGLPGASVNCGDRILIASTRRLQQWADGTLGVNLGALWARTAIDDAEEVADLPLGCILGSVEAVDALPIVGPTGALVTPEIVLLDDGQLTIWYPASGAPGDEADERDISDQLPFGDWTPGRWAWELTDPRPLDQPVPVVGKQGVWRWEP